MAGDQHQMVTGTISKVRNGHALMAGSIAQKVRDITHTRVVATCFRQDLGVAMGDRIAWGQRHVTAICVNEPTSPLSTATS